MIDFLLATQRVESTMGLTLNRLFSYIKLALAYLISTALATGTGVAAGSWVKSSGTFGLIGAVMGFALCAYFIRWSRRGRLYNLWGPHLSIFVQLVENKSIPTGKKQLELGSQKIKRLFSKPVDLMNFYDKSTTVLCEQFIEKYKLTGLAGLPLIGAGLKLKTSALLAPLRDALVILSLSEESNNPWETMHNNLKLVANHLNSIQRSVLIVLIMQVVGALFAFGVWYVAVDWLTDHWPNVDLTPWKILLTGLLSWIMYAAFIYPIAVNALLDEFLKITTQHSADDDYLAESSALNDIASQAQSYTLPAESVDQETSTNDESQHDDSEES